MCSSDLSRFLQRLTGVHAARLRRTSGTIGEGHVYQGRYHAFPLDTDTRLMRAMRYVEANPLRAALVERAEDWRWSSLSERLGTPRLISLAPVELPVAAEWLRLVNQPVPTVEVSEPCRTTARKSWAEGVRPLRQL